MTWTHAVLGRCGQSQAEWQEELHTWQHGPWKALAFRGQSTDRWSGMPQLKQVDLTSKDNQLAHSSVSGVSRVELLVDSSLSLNCASYCSHAYN